jgi:hypothetical protein
MLVFLRAFSVSLIVAVANWMSDLTASVLGVQLSWGSVYCPVAPWSADLSLSARDASLYRSPIIVLISPQCASHSLQSRKWLIDSGPYKCRLELVDFGVASDSSGHGQFAIVPGWMLVL